jgi:hypothetical protein
LLANLFPDDVGVDLPNQIIGSWICLGLWALVMLSKVHRFILLWQAIGLTKVDWCHNICRFQSCKLGQGSHLSKRGIPGLISGSNTLVESTSSHNHPLLSKRKMEVEWMVIVQQ